MQGCTRVHPSLKQRPQRCLLCSVRFVVKTMTRRYVECELVGVFEAGIKTAEPYIVTLTSALLEEHSYLISAIAGDPDHVSSRSFIPFLIKWR